MREHVYRVICDDMEVARISCMCNADAEREAFHYAEQYRSDARVEIQRRRNRGWQFVALFSQRVAG